MNYVHYALQKLKILPRQFAEMPMREKAIVIASIDLKVESEKKAARQKPKRK